jgi:citrate synthase
MTDSIWTTNLSFTSENGIVIRGYDLNQLIGTVPFPSVLYLLFTGELPNPKVAKLIDALMVASIDHGAGAPSALAARTAASGGAPLGAAAAAGLLTLNKFHGAAVQDSMEAVQKVFELCEGRKEGLDHAADMVIVEWRQAGRRIAGFGHRQHKKLDPRLEKLFDMAREAEVVGMYLEAAQAISRALKRSTGRIYQSISTGQPQPSCAKSVFLPVFLMRYSWWLALPGFLHTQMKKSLECHLCAA